MFTGIAVFIVSLVTFFWRINSFPLRNWDEAWYGEIIRNMASGQYSLLVSFWNGQYYFDKPPLYFWLSLPIVKFFGTGEWQVRFVSALAASFSVVLIFLIAKKIFKNGKIGIFSSLVFLTLGQVRDRFSHGNLDSLLVFFILGGFWLYLLSLDKKWFAPFAGLTLGFGFLVKGWLVGVFGLLVCFIYSLVVKRKITKQFYISGAFALLPFFLYLFLGYREFGIEFIDWFLFQPSAGNLSERLQFSTNVFGYLVRDVGFWFVPVLFSVPLLKKLSQEKRRILLFMGVCVFVFVFALGFLEERFDWYLLGSYPFLAILIGYFLSRLFDLERKFSFVFFTLVVFLQVVWVAKIENIYSDRSAVGANLGKLAKNIIPKDDTIVLDDKDFTSFLFYSEHKKIFVSMPQGGKEREWWFVRYRDLARFLTDNPRSWIITSEEAHLPIDISGIPQVVADDFKFFRLY